MEKKKVMFIEPIGAYSNIFSRFMTIPLLGPVYLATIAKQAGYDVSVINENILGRKIKAEEVESIDILCISCITPTIERGKEIAREYKSLRGSSESRVIVGGIHASMVPESVIGDFDQVIVGEGENIILDILSGKKKDKIVYGERPENLDELPFPDFSLIKEWNKIKTFPVMASRGCPYKCNFCSVPEMFGRDYRTRSPEHVINEISRYKKGEVFLADDNFAVNIKQTMKLLNMMIERGFKRSWSTQIRTEAAQNPELMAKMREAGCKIVYIGFESINPQTLIDMEKKQTVKDIERSIKVCHDHRIMIHGMFILGNDSDTEDIFEKTSKFCCKNRIDFVQYSISTPFQGTGLRKNLEEENRILHDQWQVYDGLHVVSKPNNRNKITPFELQQGLIQCYKNFYSWRNGIKDVCNTIKDFTISVFKNIYAKTYLPSFYPSLMKFVGKGIIKKWIKYNNPYLEYLRNPSKAKLEMI